MGEWISVVEVNGHRGPAWRNNHNLVAYRAATGFYEERHMSDEPLPVTHWMHLPEAPNVDKD